MDHCDRSLSSPTYLVGQMAVRLHLTFDMLQTIAFTHLYLIEEILVTLIKYGKIPVSRAVIYHFPLQFTLTDTHNKPK